MDGANRIRLDGACFVHRLANDVHDAAKRAVTDRHADRRARIRHLLPANETLGRVHCDGAHSVLAEMLRHFENKARAIVRRLERIQDCRKIAVELHVHNGAHDLANFTD